MPREARLAGRLKSVARRVPKPAALGLSISVAGNYPMRGFHDPCYPKPYQEITSSKRASPSADRCSTTYRANPAGLAGCGE
jgi:hypothetical protein